MEHLEVPTKELILKVMSELSGISDPHTLTVMMSQLLGAVFLPTLIDPLYEMVTGYTFTAAVGLVKTVAQSQSTALLTR